MADDTHRRVPVEEAAGDPEELDIPADGTAASPDESYGEPVGAESDVEGQPGIPEPGTEPPTSG